MRIAPEAPAESSASAQSDSPPSSPRPETASPEAEAPPAPESETAPPEDQALPAPEPQAAPTEAPTAGSPRTEAPSRENTKSEPARTATAAAAPRRRLSLMPWFLAGTVVSGAAFIMATYSALRPKPEAEGRPPGRPVFIGRAERQPPRPAKPVLAAPPAAAAPAALRPDAAPWAPAPVLPRPAVKARPQWVFEGVAYDLVSLRAVYAAELVFRDPKGAVKGRTLTQEDGRYRIALAALKRGGYGVTAEHPDFQEKCIDEISPPFKEVKEEQRRQLASLAARSRPWTGQAGSTTRRDLV
ncbi:MAG: hypothetical protein PHF00_01405, partial [Elusimicrobia bacterium]|nr:hypothetical protein [Elusimicrobiota bacterium]